MMRLNVRFQEHSRRFDLQFAENRADMLANFGEFQTVTKLLGGDPYLGGYKIKPQVEAQTLQTKHKVMTDDLTVLEIPYAEVSNISGGMTATIG